VTKILLALILIPTCLLIIWFATPLFKEIIVNTVEGWGAAAGLDGLALLIADIMPVLIPTMCFGAIIAGVIGLAMKKGT